MYLFHPILKEVLWGGAAICPFKGLPADPRKIGESWELSDVEGRRSVVAGGSESGTPLDELIRTHGASLVGRSVLDRFGERFPLLIKFIDACNDLSVQVHPDDETARQRHGSFGKTEMWYVIQALPGAALYSGFSRPIDADEFRRRVKEGTIMEVLRRYEVRPGDVFFLPAGRIHAIGSGCFVAEIQQTSDVTYRIYDYDRRDADGRPRELHIAQALDAIDYTYLPDHRTHYTPRPDSAVELAHCPYFTTHLIDLISQPITRDFARLDSFVIYICTEGVATIRDDGGRECTLRRGQTILLPATTRSVTLTPSPGGAKLLETYIPADD